MRRLRLHSGRTGICIGAVPGRHSDGILDDKHVDGIHRVMRGKQRRSAEFFDFRHEIIRSKRKRQLDIAKMIMGGLAGGVAIGALLIAWPRLSSTFAASTSSPQFAVCGMVRQTCVVDGDTFHFDGMKIRIADIDTPELEGRCEWEIAKAQEARDRLAALLSEGPFEIMPIGDRDEDQYGRKLRVVTRSGASLGDRLVSEGLARTWSGRREPWC